MRRSLSFSVLQKEHSNFCMAGQRLRAAFVEHGAQELMPIALADDATSLEKVVDPWLPQAADLAIPRAAETSTSVAESSAPPRVVIAFGSQTGNAESIAGMLAEQLEERHITVERTASLNTVIDDGVLDNDKGPVTVFAVCSTCGDGDFPDNAGKVKRWAKKLNPDALAHVRVAVLALGSAWQFMASASKWQTNLRF